MLNLNQLVLTPSANQTLCLVISPPVGVPITPLHPVSWLCTLPAVVADAELLSRQVAVAVIGAATVGSAVGDVAGWSFPVLVALAVDAAQHQVGRAAPAMTRTVVGTRVYPEGEMEEGRLFKH